MGESSQQGRRVTPSWTPISSYPLHPIYDYNVVMWVQYQQSFHPRWEGPRKPALDRILRSTQDRLPPRQSGQNHEEAGPVRPFLVHGEITLPRRFAQSSLKQVYKPKIRDY
jgi:hypothetical protein